MDAPPENERQEQPLEKKQKKRKRLRKSSDEGTKRQRADSPSLFSSDEESEQQPQQTKEEDDDLDLLPPPPSSPAPAPPTRDDDDEEEEDESGGRQTKIDQILAPVPKHEPTQEEIDEEERRDEELRKVLALRRDPENELCARWRPPPGQRLVVCSIARVIWTGENGLCKVMATTEGWNEHDTHGWKTAKQHRKDLLEEERRALEKRREHLAMEDIQRRLLDGESADSIAANPTPDDELLAPYLENIAAVQHHDEEEEEAAAAAADGDGFPGEVMEYLRHIVAVEDLSQITTKHVRRNLRRQFPDLDLSSSERRAQLKQTLASLMNGAVELQRHQQIRQQEEKSSKKKKDKNKKKKTRDGEVKKPPTGRMLPLFGRFGSTSGFVRYALHADANGNVKRILRAKPLFIAKEIDPQNGRNPTREEVNYRATKLGVYENHYNKFAQANEITGALKKAGCKSATSPVKKDYMRHVSGRAASTFFGNIFSLRSELEVLMACIVGPRKLKAIIMNHGYDSLVRDPVRIFFSRETALETNLAAAIETLAHARSPRREIMFEHPDEEQMADLSRAHEIFSNACKALKYFGSSLTEVVHFPDAPPPSSGTPVQQQQPRQQPRQQKYTEAEQRRAVEILVSRYSCMVQIRHKDAETNAATGAVIVARLMFEPELALEAKIYERLMHMALKRVPRHRAHFEHRTEAEESTAQEETEDDDDDESPVVRRIVKLIESNGLSVLDIGFGRMREVASALADRHPGEFLATTTYVSDHDASLPIVPLHRYVCENPEDEDTASIRDISSLLVLGAEALGLRTLQSLLSRFPKLRYLCLAGDSRHRRPCHTGEDHGDPFLELVRTKRADDSGPFCVSKLEPALPRREELYAELYDTYLRNSFGNSAARIEPLEGEDRILVRSKRDIGKFESECTKTRTFQCLANNASECQRVHREFCKKQDRRFRLNDVVVVRGARGSLHSSSADHALQEDDQMRSSEGITGLIVSIERLSSSTGGRSQTQGFSVPLGRDNSIKLRLVDLDNGDNVGDRRHERELVLVHAAGWSIYHATCITVRSRPTMISRRVDVSGLWLSPTTRWHDIYAALLRAREKFVVFCDDPSELGNALSRGSPSSRTLFGYLCARQK